MPAQLLRFNAGKTEAQLASEELDRALDRIRYVHLTESSGDPDRERRIDAAYARYDEAIAAYHQATGLTQPRKGTTQ